MLSAPFLLSYFPSQLEFEAVVAVLSLSLLMVFVGSRLIRELAFIVVGLMGGLVGVTIGGYVLGPLGAVIGFVGGFIAGSYATVLFLPAGLGIAVGFAGYAVAKAFIGVTVVPILVGAVGFAYGFLLTDLLLSVVSAAIGGAMLYDLLITTGLPPYEMLVVTIALTAAGVTTQLLIARRAKDLFGQPLGPYKARRSRRPIGA
jgi:hypothetical protein